MQQSSLISGDKLDNTPQPIVINEEELKIPTQPIILAPVIDKESETLIQLAIVNPATPTIRGIHVRPCPDIALLLQQKHTRSHNGKKKKHC